MKEYKHINKIVKNINKLKHDLIRPIDHNIIKYELIMLALSSTILTILAKEKAELQLNEQYYSHENENIFNIETKLEYIEDKEEIYVYGPWKKNNSSFSRNIYVYNLDNLNEKNIYNFLNAKTLNEMITYLTLTDTSEETVESLNYLQQKQGTNAHTKINGRVYNLEYKEELTYINIDEFLINQMLLLTSLISLYLGLTFSKDYYHYIMQEKAMLNKKEVTDEINILFSLIEDRLNQMLLLEGEEIDNILTELVYDGVISKYLTEKPTIDELKQLVNELLEINTYNKNLMKEYLYNNDSEELKLYPVERKLKTIPKQRGNNIS